jgi:uncharacterized membrane protein YdfJ with MMPL/SSD domain
MFQAIARFDIRFRWLIIAAWIAGTVAGASLLPSLSSVTSSSNSSFLPASAPSQQAAALAAPFQGRNAGTIAVIVAARSGRPLTTADNAAIARVEHAAANVPGVTLVREQGASADGEARKALVATSPTVGQGNAGDPAIVRAVRASFSRAGAAPGLTFHLTGPLAQATDAQAANTTNGGNIRMFTLLFVIVLLFVVFRAALAPLATLAPAVAALLLAGPLIARAGQAGLPVSVATGQLLVVLLLGAGTDYGLFLVFRLREEIRRGREPRDGLVAAMGRVGEAVTYSAATVIAALSCLALASFGLYRGLGPALAIGLAVIALLLALLLRSLIAPLYLILTVGLSYLAALGFATIVFVHVGGDQGILFLIPILLFIFAMALGEDYNILLMSRIREEARTGTLRDALTRALGATGGTITSAGLILAGTFTVLGIAGNSGQARQLGFTVGFAVFLDTFFVRTLLVPSAAVMLGRWNWWPSALSRPVGHPEPSAEQAGEPAERENRPQARRS